MFFVPWGSLGYTRGILGVYLGYTQGILTGSMNNLSSYYGLVDPRISASDKDLPVPPRKQPKNDPRK